jgi:hypothetical protein
VPIVDLIDVVFSVPPAILVIRIETVSLNVIQFIVIVINDHLCAMRLALNVRCFGIYQHLDISTIEFTKILLFVACDNSDSCGDGMFCSQSKSQ